MGSQKIPSGGDCRGTQPNLLRAAQLRQPPSPPPRAKRSAQSTYKFLQVTSNAPGKADCENRQNNATAEQVDT